MLLEQRKIMATSSGEIQQVSYQKNFFFFFKWRVGKVAGGRRLPQQSMHRHKRIEFDCDKKCTMAAAEVGEEAANVFGRAPSTQ